MLPGAVGERWRVVIPYAHISGVITKNESDYIRMKDATIERYKEEKLADIVISTNMILYMEPLPEENPKT